MRRDEQRGQVKVLPASWAVPDGLPDGQYIVPDPPYHIGEPITEPALWITDEPVPDARLGPMFARLLAAHADTGLWPLLLTEMSAPAGLRMPASSGMPADLFLAKLYPPGRPWHMGEIFPVPAHRLDKLDAGELLDYVTRAPTATRRPAPPAAWPPSAPSADGSGHIWIAE